MEQLLILLLFLALPRIIKAVAKQGQTDKKAKAPARQRPRRAPAPTPVTDESPADEVQLPPWLESLAERLGAAENKPKSPAAPQPKPFGEPDPEAPPPWHDVAHEARFEGQGGTNYEAAHPAPTITSRPVTPGPEWQRATDALRRVAAKRRQQAAAPPAPMAMAQRGPRPVTAMPRGRQGWRRAIVMAEVLGAPRALRPYEGPDSTR